MKTFYTVTKSVLLFALMAPLCLFAQQQTTVVSSSNCNFTYSFNSTDEGFSSPSIYSDANDFGIYWNGSSLSETAGSAVPIRTASTISGIFVNTESAKTTVGFDYTVPLGTQYRIRIISGVTNPPLEILATTANGSIWSNLTGTSGSVCLELQDNDLPLSAQIRYEISFRTINTGPITIDNFRRIVFAAPLPVTFMGFIAKDAPNDGVDLLWNVGEESNVRGYEVQGSTDGVNFNVLGFVPANAKDNYSYRYTGNIRGTMYFRVRNIDVDSRYKYTGIIKVRRSGETSAIRLYPVPATTQVYIEHPKTNQRATLSVYNSEGRIVTQTFTQPGSYQTQVNISSLVRGVYFVRYEDENGNTTQNRFIKN